MFSDAQLREFLEPYPAEVRRLALDSRLRLHELVGPASDLLFDATSAVCAGLSYTGNARDNFVNIAVYAKHVTLVFAWGKGLNDPENRLKGEGSRVRHNRLSGIETLHDPYVVDLIRQAADRAPRPNVPVEPVQIVKIYCGPKRRPVSASGN